MLFFLWFGFNIAQLIDERLAAVQASLDSGDLAEAERAARELLAQVEDESGRESVEAAGVLDLLVKSLWRSGESQRPETLQFAQRALQIHERVFGSASIAIATSLRNLAIIHEDSGDFALARELYERRLSVMSEALGAEDPKLTTPLIDLANLNLRLAAYPEAATCYERALVLQRLEAQESLAVALTLSNLSNLHRRTGEFEEAKQLSREALELKRTLGAEDLDLAWTMSDLAEAHRELGEYAEAMALHEEALILRRRQAGPDSLVAAYSLNGLANLLRTRGDYTEARENYERALEILASHYPDGHPVIATGRKNLGDLLFLMGDFESSRELHERVLTYRLETLGAVHPLVVASRHSLADSMAALGDREQAETLRRGIEASLEGLPESETLLYQALNARGLGQLVLARGEWDEALALFEKALSIQIELYGDDHPDTARTLQLIGNTLARQGRDRAAHETLERSLVVLQSSLSPEHPFTGAVHLDLASLAAENGRIREAVEHAAAAERIGGAHLRLTARTIPAREALRYARSRPRAMDLLLTLSTSGDAQAVSTAVDALYRSRSPVLDELESRRTLRGEIDDPELNQLAANLEAAGRRLANLSVRGPLAQSVDNYRRMLDEARSERNEAERSLAKRSERFRRDRDRALIGYDEVAAALPRGTALVSYARYTDRQTETGKYVAFVTVDGKARPVAFGLGSATSIDVAIARWRRQVGTPVPEAGKRSIAALSAYRVAGAGLKTLIWDPLQATLDGAQTVLVVPDGLLQFVNLATLPVGERSYLVEAGPLLHYLHVEREAADSSEAVKDGNGLLALGGPEFAAGASSVEDRNLSAGSTHEGDCSDLTQLSFPPLPYARVEVDRVTAIWRQGNGDDADLVRLEGKAASEAALKRLAPGRSVLHLATHGFFMAEDCASAEDGRRGIGGLVEVLPVFPGSSSVPERNPMLLSGIALSKASTRTAHPGDEDGILTAEEVSHLDLSGVDWVVLSACDSGVGQIVEGEGVFGLRRAFVVAGAGTLIMALWSVADEATADWMEALYRARFLDGTSSAGSMRQASTSILRERRAAGMTTHPFYWGAFVSAGRWR